MKALKLLDKHFEEIIRNKGAGHRVGKNRRRR